MDAAIAVVMEVSVGEATDLAVPKATQLPEMAQATVTVTATVTVMGRVGVSAAATATVTAIVKPTNTDKYDKPHNRAPRQLADNRHTDLGIALLAALLFGG